MSDNVIEVSNLKKRYRIGLKTKASSTVAEQIVDVIRTPFENFNRLRRMTSFQEDDASVFWALNGIDFSVKKGEVLGIIGRNGAGKSTLLKVLSRITEPTEGEVTIRGRVSSLLEVGTGFHPELSGRENIFMNGTILGMTRREIKSRLDEIVDFSGVEKFLDTPVKFYSSGMKVRLGFSVAAHMEPEILIIDEVLAVGDIEFQTKCIGKMENAARTGGRTILFVSHNLGAVSQLCTRGLFLTNGRVQMIGDVQDVIKTYLDAFFSKESSIEFSAVDNSKGQILSARLLNEANEATTEFPIGETPILNLSYVLHQSVKQFHVALILTDSMGNHIYSSADTDTRPELLSMRSQGRYTVKVKVPTLNLNTGQYNLSIGMGIVNSEVFHRVDAFTFSLIDVGDFGTNRDGVRRKGLLLVQNEWIYA